MLWRTLACGMMLTIAMVCSDALAQEDQHFHFSTGYANLSLGGDDSDDHSGWGFAARWRTQFIEEAPNLMLGASMQVTFYDGDNSPDGTRPVGNAGQSVPVNKSIADVDLFTPTIDLAWNQPLGDSFFIEPSIGVGWAWSSYESVVNLGQDDSTEDGFIVRPGVVVGYTSDQWSVGLDFQYSMFWIDMSTKVLGTTVSDLDDQHDEIYAGIFVRYSF